MKKTFRKAMACLLAVLMVVFSFPFTALAVESNRKWWVDDGVDVTPGALKAAPWYFGYNSTEYPDGEEYEPWEMNWGDALGYPAAFDDDYEDNRDEWKPVIGVTVSSIGTNGLGNSGYKNLYDKVYGFSTARTYDVCKADGTLINPADLKAGQRIAVTLEMGGFDMLDNAQIKGTFDSAYLVPAYFTSNPTKKDTWVQNPDSNTSSWVKTTADYGYGSGIGVGVPNTTASSFYGAIYGGKAPEGKSNYIGLDKCPFGKYGIVFGVIEFEVLQDCDLTEVFHFDRAWDGTQAEPIRRAALDDRIFNISYDDHPLTFANWATIWSEYEGGSTPQPTHEHTYDAVTTDPTCTEQGYTTYTCNNSDGLGAEGDDVQVKDYVPATGHTPVTDEAVAPTCTEAGKTAGSHCSVCNTVLTAQQTVDALGHTPKTVDGKAPTCTEAGLTEGSVCEVCGETLTAQETIDALGHTPVSADNAVAATCTTAGKEADTVCQVCGALITEGATIDALGHTPKTVDGKAPTCTEAGLTEGSVCEVCGETLTAQETIDALGHTPVSADNAVAATCTTAGKEADTVCQVCGALIEEGAVIDALGHTPVSADNAVAATCTTAGKEADTVCQVCGALIEEGAVIDALGHTWDEGVVTTEPTETTKGVMTFTCQVCGATRTEEIPEKDHEHVYVEEIVAPTCTEQGYTKMTCACGDVQFKDYVPATGHTPVSADNAVAATCTTAGKEADIVCQVCGALITEGAVIDALGHTPKTVDGKAPTCTEAGLTEGSVCEVCGETLTAQETIDALGHTPVSADNAVAATCTTAGKEADTVCQVCGALIEEGAVIDALGHTPVSADNAVAPTYDAAGKEADTVCAVCGALIEEGKEIAKLEGYTVTVVATDLGTTTLAGDDSTDGKTITVAKNSKVTLTAAAADGAQFVGWKVGNNIVTDQATYTATVLNNVVVEPVFTATVDGTFTVVFMDSFGNVIDTQTVTSGADIVVPDAPARVGSTFAGWSLTDEAIAALTEGASIVAQYAKDTTNLYNVVADGCTITTAAGTADDSTQVAYNTKVTVTKEGTTCWKIGDAVVAYGDTYTFYVGSDVTLTAVADDSVVELPTVTAVSMTKADGSHKVTFLATRNIPDGYKLVRNGFVYGKALTADELSLDKVGTTAASGGEVKVVYSTTSANQFSLNYGITKMNADATAIAFLVCTNAKGEIVTVYSEPMIYKY